MSTRSPEVTSVLRTWYVIRSGGIGLLIESRYLWGQVHQMAHHISVEGKCEVMLGCRAISDVGCTAYVHRKALNAAQFVCVQSILPKSALI